MNFKEVATMQHRLVNGLIRKFWGLRVLSSGRPLALHMGGLSSNPKK